MSETKANAQLERMGISTPQRPLELGPGLGSMRDEAFIFKADKEPGFISRALPVEGPPATFAVLRLEGRTPASFKPLAEVKAQVIHFLQGQRAYGPFIDKAEQARAKAAALGSAGLAAYFASPEGAAWKATVTSEELKVGEELHAPPAKLGGAPPPSRVAASLAMPDHPVLLLEAASEGDIPHAKLVQATAYVPATVPAKATSPAERADDYRQALEEYRWQLFQPELQRLRGEE